MSSRVLELISERKSMRRQLLVPQDRSVRSWYRQVRQPNSLRALSFTAIAAGASQAQTGITITGATTSDVAHCSLNAAPVSSWQTGIQLLPPVVAASTVK